jgi:hypothetical protein
MTTAVALAAGGQAPAAGPLVHELQTQQVGATTYFRVRFERPGDIYLPRVEQTPTSEIVRRRLSRLPLLVPQDRRAWSVYTRVGMPDHRPDVSFAAEPYRPVSIQGLEFVGKVQGGGKVPFLLLYSRGKGVKGSDVVSGTWASLPVELDFSGAVRLTAPSRAEKRSPHRASARDDLEGLWAEAQAARLAVLEVLAPDFGYYGFACAATGRKYGVRVPMLEPQAPASRDRAYRRLYETTTGAAAITESLQLYRVLHDEFRDSGRRTIDVASVPGIDIAEHPWERMLAGKKPAPEPLAGLVPRDNYYIHFKSIRKFIEFGELLDQWGTNATRAYEMTSRDYDLKGRYERQLCLHSTWMGKTLGPALVRGLAVTGSDPYLREGSDVTVIFHVADRSLFLAAVDPFLQDARQEFAGRLKETRGEYHGVPVESYATPLREVSLHRAALGDFVIYSNSPAGLRRVLDASQGRLKALADSLDFRYMRTVFRLDDRHEDGFAFLSDAFIRRLVGPAAKIKEKRRLEALTSLSMVTNAALFTAWETGKLPADHAALLAASALKPEYLYTPEGKGVTWDAGQQAAVSDAYNTIQFATPLIELPIDKVTEAERQEYLAFREDYLNLWRQYFDPVGMRVSLKDGQVRLETFILPLIRHQDYQSLREWAGAGTSSLDPASFSPETLVQATFHLAPQARNLIKRFITEGQEVGDTLVIRLDDSKPFRRLAELRVQEELDPGAQTAVWEEADKISNGIPLSAGVKVPDPKAFARALAGGSGNGLFPSGPGSPYRGVAIFRCTSPPRFYTSLIGDVWYISLNEATLKRLIDRSLARRDGKGQPKKKTVEVNASLHVAPAAAVKARDALGLYLEWQTHRRSLVNGPIWYALDHGGLIPADAPEKTRRAQALRYLGFVPVSPDGAEFVYDRSADDVVNRRHGSLRRPDLHTDIDPSSPLAQLLEQLRTLRADLRFQEDGINTVLTIDRRRPAK